MIFTSLKIYIARTKVILFDVKFNLL